ncbi:MAG: hypothetical protein AABX26_02245 [Nanoarchaeota archaeon]
MSDTDKYLREFDKITGRGKGSILRAEYKRARGLGYGELVEKSKSYMEMTDEAAKAKEEEIRAYAKELMGEGSKNLINVTAAVRGAELYEKIGKGKKAIPKLLEAARRDKNGAIQSYRTIREFIERNSGEEHRKSGTGLEGKTAIFLLSTLAGIALSVFSFNATGNAVAGMTGTGQGLLGVLLFIVGITGIFFNIKK